MLKIWFKIFVQNLKKNKLNTFVTILGMSTSVAMLILILLIWKEEKEYNKWIPNVNETYVLTNQLLLGYNLYFEHLVQLLV